MILPTQSTKSLNIVVKSNAFNFSAAFSNPNADKIHATPSFNKFKGQPINASNNATIPPLIPPIMPSSLNPSIIPMMVCTAVDIINNGKNILLKALPRSFMTPPPLFIAVPILPMLVKNPFNPRTTLPTALMILPPKNTRPIPTSAAMPSQLSLNSVIAVSMSPVKKASIILNIPKTFSMAHLIPLKSFSGSVKSRNKAARAPKRPKPFFAPSANLSNELAKSSTPPAIFSNQLA